MLFMAEMTSSTSLLEHNRSLFAFVVSIAVILLCLGCDTGESTMTPDFKGTVESRVSATLAAGQSTGVPDHQTRGPQPHETATPPPTPSATPVPAPTATPTPTLTPTPVPAPTATPTPTLTPTPVPAPTATPTPMPTPTPVPIPGPDLQVILESDTTDVYPGEYLTVNFTVSNAGDQDDEAVILEFSHSPLFVLDSMSTLSRGSLCADWTCELGSIRANESKSGDLTVRSEVFLDLDLPPVYAIEARVHGERRDQDRSNNETRIDFAYPDGVAGNLLWSTALPAPNSNLGGAIIVGDALYFAASRRIYSISKDTGEFLWQYDLGGRARVLGLHKGALIVTDGNAYSLNPDTGDVNWKHTTGSDPRGTEWTRLVDGTVYIRPLNRPELYAIDASTGELNWRYAPSLREGRRVDPVYVEGDAIIVKQNAIVISLNAITGGINWIFDAGDFPNFHIRPLIHNDAVYFFTRKDIYGIELETGKVALRRPTSMLFDEIENETVKLYVSGGLFANGKIYFGVNNLDVVALDEDMETILWHYKYGGEPPAGHYSRYVAYAANEMLYLVQPMGWAKGGQLLQQADGIYALDDWSGRRLWHFDTSGSTLDLTFNNDVAYVASRENHPGSSFLGRIEAFDTLTGEFVRRIEFSREDVELHTPLYFEISDGVLYGVGGNRVFALTVER